ncbi:MAG: hypothetical protein V9E87_07625 [Gemmatimonadales bacterium]
MRGLLAVALAALVVGCAKPDVDAAPRLIADSAISLGIEYELGDLAAGPDGSWWLLDTRNRVAAHFAPNGGPLGRLGRAGEGPGEFRTPTLIGVTASGDVAIIDIALRRLTVFSGDSANSAPRLFATPPLVSSLMMGPDSGIVTLGTGGYPPRGPSLVTIKLSGGAALDTTWIWEAAPAMVDAPGELNSFLVDLNAPFRRDRRDRHPLPDLRRGRCLARHDHMDHPGERPAPGLERGRREGAREASESRSTADHQGRQCGPSWRRGLPGRAGRRRRSPALAK